MKFADIIQLHPCENEIADKTRKTENGKRKDNVEFLVWHGSQNLCQTMRLDSCGHDPEIMVKDLVEQL